MERKLRLVSKIEGIHCLGCIGRISNRLKGDGAKNVDIDLLQKIVKVDYYGEEDTAEKFIEAINKLGYKAKKIVVFDPEEVNVD